ncbi:ABC transporter substrate-binding protein [Agarivorans sp. 1_MG-2023]|uniref:ABC transporter substrate-binding protein n=1 Tax=Agarivorans sp. 1_MG-2023 TaxID=3062634 RepID=UPI0026E38700|nr:ABC transporter substrate-binding protein [Agarivorans sp. 1_MG-2023]MDO6763045.1 ABC transporter substrate-binding protein [Agarivorans sp. 1_MG-2023]
MALLDKTKAKIHKIALLLVLIVGWVNVSPAKTLVWGTAFHAEPNVIVEEVDANSNFINHLLFDPLFLLDQQGRVAPRLVTKWKIISPTQIQFELRNDVVFHSGNPLTAEDVEWTFNRIQQQPHLQSLFAPIKSLKALNSSQFEVLTYRPFSELIQRLSYIFPADKQFYLANQELENTEIVSLVSGTGPFKLARYIPGIVTEFSINSKYWRNKRSNITQIKVVPIVQSEMRMASLFSRDVDVVDHVPDNYVELLNKDPQLSVIQTEGLKWLAIELNQRHPALANRRVRQALNLAIDNVRLAEVLGPYALASTQLSIPGLPGYNKELLPRYNLLLAHQLLQQAGFEDGFTLTIAVPKQLFGEQSKVVPQLVSMLDRVNITLVPEWLDEQEYQANIENCASDVMLTRRQSDAGDVLSIARSMFIEDTGTSPQMAGCLSYRNEKVTQLILAGEQELDEEKRDKIIQYLEQQLYQEAVFVPLYWQRKIWALNQRINIENMNRASPFPLFERLQVLD